MEKAKYELWEYDGGMGGPFDGSSKVIAYFTTIGKAVDFFNSNNIKVNGRNEPTDFDLDKRMYIEGRTTGLGACSYSLCPLQKPSHKIDPKTFGDIR